MKASFVLILLTILMTSCDNHQKDFSDLESIAFYNDEGDLLNIEQLKKDWNKTMNPVFMDEMLYEQKVKELSIKTIQDNATNEDYLVLVASTTNKNAFSGRVISFYEDGFQLSNVTVTCTNCGLEFQGELENGDWICADDGKSIDDCIKTSTLDK